MRKALLLAVVLMPFILLLTACPPAGSGLSGVTGVTVSGTVSGSYFDIIGQATVTASRSGTSISTQVTLSGSSLQSGPYSVTNVPPGNYTFVIIFYNNFNYTGSATYSIAGGAQGVAADSDIVTGSGAPYTHTITYIGVPIIENETIDIDLGNVG